MSDIFISYAKEDTSKAKMLAKALKKQGWSVWWDRKIPTGKTFDEVIEEAIDAAKCIVVLWSKSSVSSRWVRTEAGEGARRGILLPVFIEEIKIPLAFRRIQTANLIGWDGDSSSTHYIQFITDVSGVLGPSPLQTEEEQRRKTELEEKQIAEAATYQSNDRGKHEIVENNQEAAPKRDTKKKLPLLAAVISITVVVLIVTNWLFLNPTNDDLSVVQEKPKLSSGTVPHVSTNPQQGGIITENVQEVVSMETQSVALQEPVASTEVLPQPDENHKKGDIKTDKVQKIVSVQKKLVAPEMQEIRSEVQLQPSQKDQQGSIITENVQEVVSMKTQPVAPEKPVASTEVLPQPTGSLKQGNIMTDKVTGMQLVYIPQGCFLMGSLSGKQNEQPVHEVCVDGYWIAKYEVTQSQWRQIMDENPANFKMGDNYPVEGVSWEMVQDFISRLNKKSGREFRLPSEAEWEYACRAKGNSTYCGGENIDNLAWYSENSGDTAHSVGTKQENDFGLFDMSGNVWEWCLDRYGEDYYSNSPRNNPQGPASGSDRVIRGGGWRSNARYLESANRNYYEPDGRDSNLGFRLVLPPGQ